MSQKEFKFEVGNRVVYPAHGVGEITAQETQQVSGEELNLFVISFAKERMILRVPVSRAKATLRPLSSRDQVKDAFDILKSRAKAARGMWSRRAQEYELKINSGNITAIAEVVRDLHKNVEDPDRSYSERMIYESALERLAGEVAAVDSLDLPQAVAKVTKALNDKKSATTAEAA